MKLVRPVYARREPARRYIRGLPLPGVFLKAIDIVAQARPLSRRSAKS